MVSSGDDDRAPHEGRRWLRHRTVPVRHVGATVIAARPRDGAPVVMQPVAALVWRLLEGWTTGHAIDQDLATAFPDVPDEERIGACAEILAMLADEDLIERA